MTYVWRMCGIENGYLTSLMRARDQPLEEVAWHRPTRLADCALHDQPPAVDHDCGMWATPSWDSFRAWALLQHQVDIDQVRYLRAGMARYSRHEIEQTVRRLRREHGSGLWDLALTLDDSTLTAEETGKKTWAMVRCEAHGPSQPMLEDSRARQDKELHIYQRAALYGLGTSAAWDHVKRTDFPDGFRRYRSLTVRQVWLSDSCAHQVAGLRRRYRCPVQPVPGGHRWIMSLRRCTPVADTISATQRTALEAGAAVMGRT